MIGRPMSVNSSFDSHGSHNPNFPRDSSFDSRYQQHNTQKRFSTANNPGSLFDHKYFRRSGPDTGYYSDKNETRNGFRDERGYLSDHSSRYRNSAKNLLMACNDVLQFRGLAPNYRQDSIRSGYVSDHESRSGYEHRG